MRYQLHSEQKIIAIAQIFVKIDRKENFGEKMHFSPKFQKWSEEGFLNSSHFDKLEHAYKFTKEILKAKNNLVYSTHFGLSERIRTFFQKFSK